MRYWLLLILLAEALLVRDPIWWDDFVLPLMFVLFATLDYAQAKASRQKAKFFYACLGCGVNYATVYPYKGNSPHCVRCQERMMLARLMRGERP